MMSNNLVRDAFIDEIKRIRGVLWQAPDLANGLLARCQRLVRRHTARLVSSHRASRGYALGRRLYRATRSCLERLYSQVVPRGAVTRCGGSQDTSVDYSICAVNNPKVGVIVATVGRPTLEAAIRSIRAQSFTDWIGVVVFDGFVPREFDGFETVHLRNGPHQDWGATGRNVGMAYLWDRVNLFAYLDDDCTWFDDHLRHLVPLATQSGWAYRGSRIFYPNGTQQERMRAFDAAAYAEENFIDTNEIVHRKEAGQRWTAEQYESDWLFGQQLLRTFGAPAFYPAVLGTYRQRWNMSREVTLD